ncbi:MAG: class I SAM-dependent methyltransferase [Pseudomonadota bacterium]
MITFDAILDATSDPRIRDLEIGAFEPADVVNLILQRSEIVRDRPRSGRLIRAWVDGDETPLRAVVDEMGDDLIRRAAAIIWLEYQEMKPILDTLSPRRVADIGCGYAVFDLFLWQDQKPHLLLIDLETSDERHFGFDKTGAAYTSLAVAERFLTDNGVDPGAIVCRNPEKVDITREPSVDLAVSLVSCGYHYPVDTYWDFFLRTVTPDGAVILDLRARKAAEASALLESMGTLATLTDAADGTARRVVLRKGAAG